MAGEAATLPSSSRSSSTSLPKTFTYKKYSSTNLHNNTISSYLNSSSSSETFKNTSPSIDTQKHKMRFGKKKKEDVVGLSFNSEKHFNGGIREKGRNSKAIDRGGRKIQRKKNDNNVHPKGVKPEAKPQKKSVAASVLKYWFPCELKKVNIRRFFPSFGCKCTCARAKSVDIENSVRESKTSLQSRNKKVNHEGVDKCKEIRKVCNGVFNRNPFSLVLNEYTQPESSSEDEISCQKYDSLSSDLQKSSDSPVLSSVVEDATVVGTQIQEKTRKPLEVFGSPISGKNVSCRVTETPKIFSSDAMFYDGDDSDSSSDLFEIKNINFSRLSDSSAEKTPRLSKNKKKGLLASASTPKRNTPIEKTSISTSMQKRRDDILLSCRSYKAVNVARNNTYSIAKETQSDPQIRHRLEDSATPVSENRTGHARHRDFKVTHVIRTLRRNSFS